MLITACSSHALIARGCIYVDPMARQYLRLSICLSIFQIQTLPGFRASGGGGLRLIIHTLIPILPWGPRDSGPQQLGEQGAFERARERLLAQPLDLAVGGEVDNGDLAERRPSLLRMYPC